MTKTIIAFGASNSKQSINRRLANFVAHQISEAKVILLDLNHFEMPIYSMDREKESGIPEQARRFRELILSADGIVISFAEHNGSYSVAFKNIFDWASRIDSDVWDHKPMFLLATSPGSRGGKTVLETALNKFRRMNKHTIVSFSLPSFYQNFSEDTGITNDSLLAVFNQQLGLFGEALTLNEINTFQK